jgi:hypothetical protein
MSDHTPLLNDTTPASPDAANGEPAAARDAPPRQPLADQTPSLTDAHFEALQAADQAMCEAHPLSLVAYVDTWVGEKLERLVVVTEKEPAAFQAALARLDPAVRRRCELTHTPDPDAFELPSYLAD